MVIMGQADWLTLIILFLFFGILFALLCLFMKPLIPMLQASYQMRMKEMEERRKKDEQRECYD